jgi:hypothetical protein
MLLAMLPMLSYALAYALTSVEGYSKINVDAV